jgi:hypothetical protein
MSSSNFKREALRGLALLFLMGTVTAQVSGQSAGQQAADEKCASLSNSEYVKCISDAMASPAESDPKTKARKLEDLRQRKSALEVEIGKLNEGIRDIETNDKASQTTRPNYFIETFGIAQINSAGGVEPFAVLVNPDSKSPIKYVRIQTTLYNAVGDVIGSSIGGKTTANLSFTGPLSFEDGKRSIEWEPVWYNSTGECIKIDAIQVTFISGRVASFSGKSLRSAIAPSIENECKLRKRP